MTAAVRLLREKIMPCSLVHAASSSESRTIRYMNNSETTHRENSCREKEKTIIIKFKKKLRYRKKKKNKINTFKAT